MSRGRYVVLLLASLTSTLPVLAADELDFSETIKRPNYRASFERMLKGEKDLPSWMATPAALEEATTLSGSRRVIDGEEEDVFELCKSHECDDSGLIVIFAKNGEIAKGLLSDKKDIFFGEPTPAEKKALTTLKRSN
jgi:hypothetical protein